MVYSPLIPPTLDLSSICCMGFLLSRQTNTNSTGLCLFLFEVVLGRVVLYIAAFCRISVACLIFIRSSSPPPFTPYPTPPRCTSVKPLLPHPHLHRSRLPHIRLVLVHVRRLESREIIGLVGLLQHSTCRWHISLECSVEILVQQTG